MDNDKVKEGVKPTLCPTCGAKLDAATHAGTLDPELRPKPGDLTLCAYCDALLQFDDEGKPVLFDGRQLNERTKSRVELARARTRSFRALRRRGKGKGE